MAQLTYPADLRFAKTHEWVRLNGDEATVGISDYAQDELGDVVSLELPWDDVGQRDMQAERHFGDIDSVKATSELFAPVSGQLVKTNTALRDAPEVINTDPYGQGWMLVIKLADTAQVEKLMTAAQYQEFLQTHGH